MCLGLREGGSLGSSTSFSELDKQSDTSLPQRFRLMQVRRLMGVVNLMDVLIRLSPAKNLCALCVLGG